MKRVRIESNEVTALPELVEAAHRAARAKRDRPDVRAFFGRLERSLSHVQQALLDARLPHGSYRRFSIRDPKPRIIHAAPFADRVAHHALMRPMDVPLDQWQPATSFACRRGKGVHTAIVHAQRQCRRYPWFVKMDVSGYFEHINHSVLIELLHRRLKGSWLFRLLEAILASHCSVPGRGLPIGALTSQHFANIYLVPADQWLISHPMCRAHCRYMDDTVVWAESREEANRLWHDYRDWLAQTLHLSLKPVVVQRTRHGLTLCGIRIRPHALRPSRRRQQQFRRQLQHWERSYQDADIDMLILQRRVDALIAMLLPGQSLQWRRKLMSRRLHAESEVESEEGEL